jgi:hypothetical protein
MLRNAKRELKESKVIIAINSEISVIVPSAAYSHIMIK